MMMIMMMMVFITMIMVIRRRQKKKRKKRVGHEQAQHPHSVNTGDEERVRRWAVIGGERVT